METNNKLRKACANIAEYARSAMCHATDAHVLGYLNQIEGWAKTALAEPVKNCEVGTVAEQAERMDMFCNSHGHGFDGQKCYACENCKLISIDRCELAWAQMPYEAEEGGAK